MTAWEIVLLVLSVLAIVGFLGLVGYAFWLIGIKTMGEAGISEEEIEKSQTETATRLAQDSQNSV